MIQNFTLFAGTSPATASTSIKTPVRGLSRYTFFTVDADLVGATAGALDVYIQRELTTDVWRDWLHYTQLAAGAAAVRYTSQAGMAGGTTITAVGVGGAATFTGALATGSFIGGHPGNAVRVVLVAGASTSAGAAISVTMTGIRI